MRIARSVTPANVNDITAATAMPIEPGATYVYDIGYYDYRWWAQIDEVGSRFVTRLKKNTPFRMVRENRVRKTSNILSDRLVFLTQRLASSRKTGASGGTRDPGDDRCKILRIVTNDLDAPAQEIADLCKQRWQTELFFRWIKQTLRIKCRTHSVCRRLDRFSSLAHGAGHPNSRAQSVRIRPSGAHKSHAQAPPPSIGLLEPPEPSRSIQIS
jgi:IS4 transposase